MEEYRTLGYLGLAVLVFAIGVIVVHRDNKRPEQKTKIRTSRGHEKTTRVLYRCKTVEVFDGVHPFNTDFSALKPISSFRVTGEIPKGHVPLS